MRKSELPEYPEPIDEFEVRYRKAMIEYAEIMISGFRQSDLDRWNKKLEENFPPNECRVIREMVEVESTLQDAFVARAHHVQRSNPRTRQ